MGRTLVMKFGGTSVAGADRMAGIANLAAAALETNRVCLVASALSGVTNLLMAAAESAARGAEPEPAQEEFLARHRALAVELGLQEPAVAAVLETLGGGLGKLLRGSHGGESLPAEDIPRYIRMMRDGRFDPRSFVSHRISLAEVNDGIARMRAGEVIHCIIHF